MELTNARLIICVYSEHNLCVLNLNLPQQPMKSFLQLSVQVMSDPLVEHFQYAGIISNTD